MTKTKELRLARGLSQQQLASAAGLTITTLRKVENGHNVRVSTLRQLAMVLNVRTADLLEEDA